ncbi:MAG: hypothetical protein E7G33_17810 [Bacteroides sp.]|nr:hypothetical protein [Bacteroides sp.]
MSKHRLGVRQCPFLRLCGSWHTFVPNSFWAMVCRRIIPLLRKNLMNEGIKLLLHTKSSLKVTQRAEG